MFAQLRFALMKEVVSREYFLWGFLVFGGKRKDSTLLDDEKALSEVSNQPLSYGNCGD
jgi:hypothetical protein